MNPISTLVFVLLLTVFSTQIFCQNLIDQACGSAKDKGLKQALTNCAENYGDAIDQIQSSTAALGSKKYNDVKTWVSAAMNNAASCEQGFQDQSAKSPIASSSTTFTQLSSNVLAITNHL
ncbi:hypothetical protein ACB092_03G038300 [Castanea dentata]